MPATIIELPPTATDAAPRMAWTPHVETNGRTGTLAIRCGRTAAVYRVEELPTGSQGWTGRAFTLRKIGKGTSGERYAVFCAAPGGFDLCECAGFAYGHGKPCKHLLAVREIIRLGSASNEIARPAPKPVQTFEPMTPTCNADLDHF